jgi:hypothetical protein
MGTPIVIAPVNFFVSTLFIPLEEAYSGVDYINLCQEYEGLEGPTATG